MKRDDFRYRGALRLIEPQRGFEPDRSAREAATGPTATQYVLSVALLSVFGVAVCIDHALFFDLPHLGLFVAFAAAMGWRAAATLVGGPPRRVARLNDADLPSYTVIVPLYREADMVAGLIGALSALDYPSDRLQILIVLEDDDRETLQALGQTKAAAFDIIVAPPGVPRTKPRACNIALAEAIGRYVVVYDAEDRPHPLQLREAAARFESGEPTLACLQAPLRIFATKGFLSRQFGLEYAAQFEVILPALARFGASFPLGGTSNHFRTAVLQGLGGWDPWNVTEDADLGFRLAKHGWRASMLRTPTWESAPERLKDWLPQRTRWVKGYMQTWGVHMRAPFSGGFRRFTTLQATLGLAILSAVIHGPVLLLILVDLVFAFVAGRPPRASLADLALLGGGWIGAVSTMTMGARRAGLRMRLFDAFVAPFYWALHSLAASWSIWQLCTRPHHWNKTNHQPPADRRIGGAAFQGGLDAKGAAGVRRAA